MNYKILAIILFVVITIYNSFLLILEFCSRNNKIPEKVNDVYDEITYKKWQKYTAEKVRLNLVFTLLQFIIYLLFIVFDVFSLLCKNIDNVYLSSLVVISLTIGVDAILNIVQSYIDTMVIEEKYEFNKTTLSTFIGDQIKNFIITVIITVGLLFLFILLHQWLADWIILAFTLIACLLMAALMFLFPKLSQIFNKFVPLEEGELRESLLFLLNKHGYHVKEIKVMDASKRTTKSNAYFAGYGKTKTIVLYDTLLKNLTSDEILAVFAHELGHGLHKDTIKSVLKSFMMIALIVVLAFLLIKFPEIYADFGFSGINYGFGYILLSMVIMPIAGVIISLISSSSSRKAEYAADAFAAKEGYGKQLISSLKKLSRENFASLAPNKIIVKLSYSHPTLLERIENIEKNI